MNIEEFREFCLSLKGATEKMPFDQTTLVFYVGGKIFCLTDIEDFEFINLKCEPEKAVELREQYPGVLPGYHMNKRHWNSVMMDGSVPLSLVRQWVRESYELVVKGLPRGLREKYS